MKGSKEGVFSEFLLSPSLGSGSVKGGQFSVTIGGQFSMTIGGQFSMTFDTGRSGQQPSAAGTASSADAQCRLFGQGNEKLPRQLYQFVHMVAFFAHPAVQVDSASAQAIPEKTVHLFEPGTLRRACMAHIQPCRLVRGGFAASSSILLTPA